MKETDLSYNEKKENLAIRIEAHKRFSNFSLEEWIDSALPAKEGGILLDAGCGDGNLFNSYSRKLGENGLIIGIDKDRDLLLKASGRQLSCRKLLMEFDINLRLPFTDKAFDLIVSAFSIYYIDDARSLMNEFKRILIDDGCLLIIGPADNNAGQLYEFNRKVFGVPADGKADARAARIRKEFLPLAKEIFGKVEDEIIPSKIIFPGKEEFVKYYMATLLFEESCKRSGSVPSREELLNVKFDSWEVSKEMIALKIRKNE